MSERGFWIKCIFFLLALGSIVGTCNDSVKTKRLNLLEERVRQLESERR